jgi:spoIIIJ-associated protein
MEFYGISVEKAVESACKDLKISKEDLKYDIISYGSSGIFGLVGVKKAKIKVTLNGLNMVSEDKTEVGTEQGKSELNYKEESVFEQKLAGSADEETSNNPVEAGREALTHIINSMCDNAVINVRVDDRDVFYDIESKTPSVIIGKKGQTLDAIQYLVEKIVKKNNNDKYNIIIDVGGYLNKRHEKLKKFAEKIAQKSKENGKPMSLGQLNANDRRIIHQYLKNDEEVKTHSVGEGFIKKLIIYPRKKNRQCQPQKEL